MEPTAANAAAEDRAPDVAPSPALWRLGIVGWLGRHPLIERRRTEFGLWWGNRTPRERRLLIALAGSAAVVLLIVAIYRPLADARAQASADIRTYEMLAAQLKIAGPELARLRAMGDGGSPQTLMSSASAFGITPQRIDPQGDLMVVSVRNADFTKLVQWLVQVESTTTLRVSQVTMERTDLPGIVNARIGLIR